MTTILVNLLANALDATEGRGEVGISWRAGPKGGELTVWDTGPGFEGDPSRLFAPWYTTKERGTGLGSRSPTAWFALTAGRRGSAARREDVLRRVGAAGRYRSASDKVMVTEPAQSEAVQVETSGSNEGVA